jgi:hypothetical protein
MSQTQDANLNFERGWRAQNLDYKTLHYDNNSQVARSCQTSPTCTTSLEASGASNADKSRYDSSSLRCGLLRFPQ